ncbi:ChbG/HpnK family deacetylase [bacterium]|nr:ChbG/HpnK family deacetylase [bacterium]
MRLIVNADDLGMSREVNDATFALIDQGLITSSTIMANAPAFEDAVHRAQEFPQVSFGVHLNLTQFAPLSDPDRLRPLLNEDGEFQNPLNLSALNRGLATAILDEWTAQVQRVREAGVNVSHIDSHHHVHMSWALLRVLTELQKRLDIHRVRAPKTVFLQPMTPRLHAIRLRCLAWKRAVRTPYPTHMTDTFAEYETIHKLHVARPLRFEIAEAMVHPNHPMYADETTLLRHNAHEIPDLERVSFWEV